MPFLPFFLPFQQLTGLQQCSCGDPNCGTFTEEDYLSITFGADDSTESCAVTVIQHTLNSLLGVIVQDAHTVETLSSDEDLQCRVDFEARRQILDVRDKVNSLLPMDPTQRCPVVSSGSNSHACGPHAELAFLQLVPSLLGNGTYSQSEYELAESLDEVLLHFEVLLEYHLQVGL